MLSSTPFLGVVLALATWNLTFSGPGPGIDQSWVAGLYMAAHRGMHFGSDVVFTWGPLTFLRLPYLYYGGLATIGFLYSAAVYLALCISLVWVLRRSVGIWVGWPIAFVLLALLPVVNQGVVLAAVWCLTLLSRDPPPWARWIVVYGLSAYGAVECLVRLSPGPAILLMAALALLAPPIRWRDLAGFAATALLTFWILWFATGQGLGNVPEYVHGSLEIVSGYSQAMAIDDAPRWWALAAVGAFALLIAGAAAAPRTRPRQILAGLVMAAAGFAAFKEGIVRFESGHAEILFATIAALALAVSWRRRTLPVGALVLLGAGAIALHSTPPGAIRTLDPFQHLDTAQTAARTLVDPGKREAITEAGRETMIATYDIDPGTLRLLRGRPVQIEPWEAGVAWAYRLDWDPLPVFQEYSAYTSYLDHRNADRLLSPEGPTRVLRQNLGEPGAEVPAPSVDGRLGVWDPPATAVALLCGFAPLRTTDRWQVLARSEDRCGAPRPVGSVETEYGQTVRVPSAKGEVVLARIHGAGVSGLERIRSALYRARLRFAVVDGTTYRLVPGTAADGLIMSVPRRDDFPGAAFRLSPDVHTLSLQGTSGKLEVDFYAMPIRPWREIR